MAYATAAVENRMRRVQGPGGLDQTTTYVADTWQRALLNDGTNVTKFHYGLGGELLGEYQTSGAQDNLLRSYIYDGLDTTVGSYEYGASVFQEHVNDGLGSTRDILRNGSIHQSSDFLAYGQRIQTGTPATPLGFTGRRLNTATGLQYNRRRYYDPVHMVWTSRDPKFVGSPSKHQELDNLYRYARNSPVSAADPWGTRILIGGKRYDDDKLIAHLMAKYEKYSRGRPSPKYDQVWRMAQRLEADPRYFRFRSYDHLFSVGWTHGPLDRADYVQMLDLRAHGGTLTPAGRQRLKTLAFRQRFCTSTEELKRATRPPPSSPWVVEMMTERFGKIRGGVYARGGFKGTYGWHYGAVDWMIVPAGDPMWYYRWNLGLPKRYYATVHQPMGKGGLGAVLARGVSTESQYAAIVDAREKARKILGEDLEWQEVKDDRVRQQMQYVIVQFGALLGGYAMMGARDPFSAVRRALRPRIPGFRLRPPAAAKPTGINAGVLGRQVIFKSAHGARHLSGTGLTSETVESAITGHIRQATRGASTTGRFWGRVAVEGQVIEYRAFTLQGETISVGTYYPVVP